MKPATFVALTFLAIPAIARADDADAVYGAYSAYQRDTTAQHEADQDQIRALQQQLEDERSRAAFWAIGPGAPGPEDRHDR